ncbi:terpene synthase family protein [Kitasatospora aureofaciens]|uniref:terpene synthase family protein n=1 Tax=Kitasatospora aureofaciens TaxID=1894 RepID=UPI0036F46855
MAPAHRRRLGGLPGRLAHQDRRPGARRPARPLLPPPHHWRARRRTIGVRPLAALAERAGRLEVPLPAWHSSHLEAMRIATCDAIIAMNEIHSLDKDGAGGHPTPS